MDMLLISPDHGNRKNNFPWGILAIGSYLTNVQKKVVRILDCSNLSNQVFNRELDRLLPKVSLVGIGCFTTDVAFVKEIVDKIKLTRPAVKIIIGGPHAVLEPEQTCNYKNIDFVGYSYGEETITYLLEELQRNNPVYENVPGLIYKANDGMKRTKPPKYVGYYKTNYELLPAGTRETFHDYIQIIAGRGCPFRCRFCYVSIVRQPFMPVPAEVIIDEIEDVVNKYNPKVIYFRDENFFQDKKRIVAFIDLYKKKGFAFRWRATGRANHFNDKYINTKFLKELESINCECLKMGIECGTQKMLNYLHKGNTIKGIKRAIIEIAQSSSIRGNYAFMIGLPNETVEDYIETIKLIRFIISHEPKADIVGPQYFRLYPGGNLFNEIVERFGYEKPRSFEEWARVMDKRNDPLGLYKNQKYSWIPNEGRFLALYSDLLILLYKKPLRDFLTFKRFPAFPFALMAKLRVQNDWYSNLYDISLFAKVYNLFNVINKGKIRN